MRPRQRLLQIRNFPYEWDQILQRNLALHEFAHQLDGENDRVGAAGAGIGARSHSKTRVAA